MKCFIFAPVHIIGLHDIRTLHFSSALIQIHGAVRIVHLMCFPASAESQRQMEKLIND
uniref:Uncharacterized protein n=1 Tax=Myripristis murdjan TaxID=586833 RepID=A0A667XVA5_9TELE